MNDFDAEDLPHWWQRWLAEGAGVVALVAVLFAAIWVGQMLGPILPNFLAWLTAVLS